MLNLAASKTVSQFGFTSTAYVTNGGTATVMIDTQGWETAIIDVILSGANTTSNAPSAITLSEADVTNTSSFVTVGSLSFATTTSTSAINAIPVTGVATGFTAVNVFRVNADLRPRKRYLAVNVSPATTQAVVVDCHLGRGANVPITASSYNVQAVAEG